MSVSGSRLLAVGRPVAALCGASTSALVGLAVVYDRSPQGATAALELMLFAAGAMAVACAFASWLIAFAALNRPDIALSDDKRKFWRHVLVLLAFLGAWWFLFSIPIPAKPPE